MVPTAAHLAEQQSARYANEQRSLPFAGRATTQWLYIELEYACQARRLRA